MCLLHLEFYTILGGASLPSNVLCGLLHLVTLYSVLVANYIRL